MIVLNILPANLKNELKSRDSFRLLLRIVVIFMLLLIFCSGLLTASMFILWTHYKTTIGQSSVKNKDSLDYNNNVSIINKQLNDIKNIQENFTSLTDLIGVITDFVNDDIVFSQIKIDRISSKLVLSGRANTRESLLEFKDALDASKIFGEIDLPTKNLFTKSDIDFEISSTINQYEFE